MPATAKKKRWMDPAKFEAFYRLGWPYADIAHANFEATGWLPTVSAVAYKCKRMELPPRRPRRRDLIRGTIRPEHAHDPIYYALQAIDRQRAGSPLERPDEYRAEWLRDLLTRRGTPLVILYLPAWGLVTAQGWALQPATDDDTDIVRWPLPVAAAVPRGDDAARDPG